MKKIVLCFCLFLVGCSNKQTTTVCAFTQENVKVVNTIVAQEDKVIKQTLKNIDRMILLITLEMH